MADVLTIPTRTDHDNYELKLRLEGVEYAFTFMWNYRAEFWSMSIAGVVDGVALRVGSDPLEFVPTEGRPPGVFTVVDSSGADEDPGLTDLGGRVLLLYRESV